MINFMFNKIYMEIGYEYVVDLVLVLFYEKK